MPNVTVIIPAFNAAATIAETLESVVAQTMADFECIVVNDGSTDNTSAIARRCSEKDSRFRVIDKANSGVADARNLGIAESRTPLVAVLDADDVWHSTFLEKLSAALTTQDSRPGFAYAKSRIIDMSGRIVDSGLAFEMGGPALNQMLQHNFVGNGSAIMFWRSDALEVGGYEPRLHHEFGAQGVEDLLFQLRLAARGPIVIVPEFLVGYRKGPGVMSSNHLRMAMARIILLKIVKDTIPEVDGEIWSYCMGREQALLAAQLLRHRRYRSAVSALLFGLRFDAAGVRSAIKTMRGRFGMRLRTRLGYRSWITQQIVYGQPFAGCDPSADRLLPPGDVAPSRERDLNAKRREAIAKDAALSRGREADLKLRFGQPSRRQ